MKQEKPRTRWILVIAYIGVVLVALLGGFIAAKLGF